MRRSIKIGLAAVLLISLVFISVSKEVPTAFVEMEVKGVRLDGLRQNPVVILTDRGDQRALPIWIGLLEANAIEKELKHIPSPRPLTHDLLHSILGRVHAKVKEVQIIELKNQTYYATLFLLLNKDIIEVDARPSDAIIIALKSKVPIFVSSKILNEQGIPLSQKMTSEERHGIRVQELSLPLASHFKFKGEKGVLVSEVTSDSVSEAAGMKAGDIITRINLHEVGSVREFGEAFDAVKPGDPLRIQLFRDETFQEVNLILKH